MAPAKGNSVAIPVVEFTEEQFALAFAIETRAQFEKAVAEIATKKVKKAAIESREAEKISAVQARYATSLENLSKEISERLDAAYVYALKNEASVFGDVKTLALLLAEVSFVRCPASVQ